MCRFYDHLYKFNRRRRSGIRVFLQKYNHLQPPDAADVCHGGHNY